MSMQPSEAQPSSLFETAAAWHLRQRAATPTQADQTEFAAWLDADLAHRLAYADVCAAALACEQIEAAAAQEAAATLSGGPPRLLGQRPTARRRRRRLFAVAALAACVLALVTAPGLLLQWRADLLGQPGLVQRHLLPDGSTLHLDGASAVRLHFDERQRLVEVLKGAVHVDVAVDRERPFRVSYGDLQARALGTAFTFSSDGERQRVSVIHGTVEVRRDSGVARRLDAGQAVESEGRGGLGEVFAAPAADLGWSEGQLVFSATPFADAVAAMARHLPERVVLARPRQAAAVTAVAPVTAASELLERLARERGYRSARIPGIVIVLI